MTLLSSMVNPGGITPGDNIRAGTAVSIPAASTTTLLTVASGGGVLQNIMFNYAGATSSTIITNIKVTVDGASERTLDLSGVNLNLFTYLSGGGFAPAAFVLPLYLPFETSLTLKVSTTAGGDIRGVAFYSVNS